MSTGKLVAIALTVVLGLIMVYMIAQDASSSKQAKQAQKQVEQTPELTPEERGFVEKSEEDEQLAELKKLASSVTRKSVSNMYLIRCSSCHGKNGEGTPVGPAIQGKSVEYMLAKLDDYRQDRVPNTLMRGLLDNISDEELATLAVEISNL